MRGFNLFAKGKRSLRRDAPEKQSTKIHYFSGEEFQLVVSLAREIKGAVSIAVAGKTGWFLRIQGSFCFLEQKKQSRQFEKDCSFYPLINFWFPDFVVFESVTRAAHYLRMKDGRMILDHYDGTIGFKEEASFKLAKKKRRISTMEETKDDNEVTLNAKETAGSDCCCSDCVSEVSFQIYEESSFICENCDCKNDFAEQDSKNGNIND